nr:hypothetical protein RCYEFQYI_RCYEFQYI_CDS_0005 [Microvirus sp.]
MVLKNDSQRCSKDLPFPPASNDYFKVVVTASYDSGAKTFRYALRTDCVDAFMNSVYDTWNNDAVIQFNGIFTFADNRSWFLMV